MLAATVQITIYRWEGALGPFRITSECLECDFTLAQVHSVLSSHPDWQVELQVKPWLNHCWEALLKGGWHAPVVLVDDKLISQGKVPSYDVLKNAVQHAASRSASVRPGFWRRLFKRLPPAPS